MLPSTGADAIAEGLGAALSGAIRLPDEAACKRYARDHFDNAVIARRVAGVYEEAIQAAG